MSQSAVDVDRVIAKITSDLDHGRIECEAEDLELARRAGLPLEPIEESFEKVRKQRYEKEQLAEIAAVNAGAKASLKKPGVQPIIAPAIEAVVEAARFRRREAEPGFAQPKGEAGEAVKRLLESPKALGPAMVPALAQRGLVVELAKLHQKEPVEYQKQLAACAPLFGLGGPHAETALHREVMKHIEKQKPKRKAELSQPEKLYQLARTIGDVWRSTEDGVGYITLARDGHHENYKIDSSRFESILRVEYSRRHSREVDGKPVAAMLDNAVLSKVAAQLQGEAMYSERLAEPKLRVGGTTREVWLDLGGPGWVLVKVTADGWTTTTQGPNDVAFIRTAGMRELPIPVKGGNIRELRKFLNCQEADFVLEVGWLIGAARPKGPYSHKGNVGVADSGKTTATRIAHSVLDPHTAMLRNLRSEDDMMVAAANGFLQSFDNQGKLSREMSDLLSRLATGAGLAKRALRTDSDQIGWMFMRPALFNGIPTELAAAPDLASRTIITEYKAMGEDVMQDEEEFWEEFREAHPRILGALLDGVAGAIKGYRAIDLAGYGRFRMAGFARWAEAGCRAVGFGEGEFLEAYARNLGRGMDVIFRNDPVAQAVAMLIDEAGGEWQGNATALYKDCIAASKKAKRRDVYAAKAMPADPIWFGRKLRHSEPLLRKRGIEVEFDVDLRKLGIGEAHGYVIQRRDPQMPAT
jgi:hypothetical protein